MKNPVIYKVNDKVLNNSLPTIYEPSLTILNKNDKEISVHAILHASDAAEGCQVYALSDGVTRDMLSESNGVIHIVKSDVFVISDNCNYHLNPEPDYLALSDTNKIDQIEQTVIDAAYVTNCKTIAKGEWTVVFAKPNNGKTLVVLSTMVQQIIAGGINGKDIFYFNLDDAMPAYLEKLKILAPYCVAVFDNTPVERMTDLINKRRAKDKIIVIDTLIRICDTNLRSEVLALSDICRRFCALGGTVITLAHANKHLAKDGTPVLEGVGLIENNANNVSYLQKIDDLIKWVNKKKRTYVEPEVIFQIGKNLPYPELFNSVHALSGQQAEQMLEERSQDQLIQNYPNIVQAIKDSILNGDDLRTKLAFKVRDNTGEQLKTIYRVLDELVGKLWLVTNGPNNSKNYTLI